ncbi:hypothetical protein [Alkalicoccus luteus]|nr:hypothetical protein [Alkalicoccus luteus]
MPFVDLNGTESSDCADSTGVPAGHIGETALLVGEQRHNRQTRLFFYVYHKFDEGLASLFNIETSDLGGYPYGTGSYLHNQHMKRTARCRHRRISTPGGSERGEDPALPTAGGIG